MRRDLEWGTKLNIFVSVWSHCCRNLNAGMVICIYTQCLLPSCSVCFERAEETCGLELSVTGALGFRTIYQVAWSSLSLYTETLKATLPCASRWYLEILFTVCAVVTLNTHACTLILVCADKALLMYYRLMQRRKWFCLQHLAQQLEQNLMPGEKHLL